MSTNQVARDPRDVLRKERRALVLAAEDVIDKRAGGHQAIRRTGVQVQIGAAEGVVAGGRHARV